MTVANDRSQQSRKLKCEGYMMAIMEDHLRKLGGSTLPVVYPMIMYSGKRKYNYSTNLFDLFGEQKELAIQTFFNSCQLVDISKIPAEEVSQLLWYGTLAEAMRCVHEYSQDINQMLNHVISKLRMIAKYGNLSYISTIITYFSEVGEMRDQKEFTNIMKRNFTRKEEKKIMTYAEQLRLEGRSEGRTEATRNVAIKLLQRNSEPDVVASVTDLPLTQILELRKKIRSCKK